MTRIIVMLLVEMILSQSIVLAYNPLVEQEEMSFVQIKRSWSAWGDYDNDELLDLVIAGQKWDGTAVTKLYRNNGNNSFTEQTSIALPPVTSCEIIWIDYNNDELLDILLMGRLNGSITHPITRIYKNNGNNSFAELTDIQFPELLYGSTAIGDFDNDGYVDILICGQTIQHNDVTKIFRNNKEGSFIEQSNIFLDPIFYGRVLWFDYDNDSDPDILMSGLIDGFKISRIYENLGNNMFEEQSSISFPGLSDPSIDCGDFNNDGNLDIVLSGDHLTGSISKVFKNNGNKTFSELTGLTLPGLPHDGEASWIDFDNDGDLDLALNGYLNLSQDSGYIFRNDNGDNFVKQLDVSFISTVEGSSSWGDYDNDGDADFFVTGLSENGTKAISKLYRNETSLINNPPDSPALAGGEVLENVVTLKWHPATDDHTASKGLSYNVRVGTISEGNDVVSSNAAANGYFRLAQMGNAQLDTFFILKSLPVGTYYWSVQAIDNCFKGGAFSEEGTFTITTVSVDDIKKNEKQIKIYPNPAISSIHVEHAPSISVVSIYNITGCLIRKVKLDSGNNLVDINDLLPGLYVLKINNSGKSKNLTFIKH